MKKKRFTEEQIAFALRQAESGVSVGEACRKMQISEQTALRMRIRDLAGVHVSRLDQWAYLHGVHLEFSRRGKPTDRACRFNRLVKACQWRAEFRTRCALVFSAGRQAGALAGRIAAHEFWIGGRHAARQTRLRHGEGQPGA